jgi:hypothetical protein
MMEKMRKLVVSGRVWAGATGKELSGTIVMLYKLIRVVF